MCLFRPGEKIRLKTFITPTNIATVAMLVLLATGWRLPAPVQQFCSAVGGCTTCLLYTSKREMEKYDLIIVGAGPAGIFTAVELLRHGSKKKMLLVEKGKPVEKRHCPKAEVGHCVNCRPCLLYTSRCV